MTVQETSQIFKILQIAYPQNFSEMTDKAKTEQIKFWATMFDGQKFDVVSAAVKAHIATSPFAPKISDIISKIQLITIPQSMGEAEAWSKVRKAISNSGYHSVEEFEKLPEECKAVVCTPEQLKAWAIMDEDEVNTVIASNFQRAYRTRTKKQEELNALPSSVRDLISDVTQRMLEGQNEGDNCNIGS